MNKSKLFYLIIMLITSINVNAYSPIDGLLERICKGSSKNFIIEMKKSENDFFELSQKGDKVVISGNKYVSIATGLNWYLKYYAGIHLSWNNMNADIPKSLPRVNKREYHETNLRYRYDFNYCTFSYSMAFWDWNRWEKEIDWMALHGINLPLDIVGTDVVWYNVLKKLGYDKKEINEFIAGPGFQAWWLMDNLEGWGGPNPDGWYKHSEELQKKIIRRMREYGITPVFPGYSGMIPHNAKEKLGLNVADPGKWGSFNRPAFIQPTDKHFGKIAELYYNEMTRLYGKSDYYSMDPFHEGGNVSGVDLDAAGKAILNAMKKANKNAVWVIQAWQENPREAMIRNIPKGELLVLDLFSESRPQWGDPESSWYRKNGFCGHDWLYCMLLNYGANVGLHGKMSHVIDEFYKAKQSPFVNSMKGIGMTMEGIENNPVMYELLCELPWRPNKFDKDEWLNGYLKARYGKSDTLVMKSWEILSNTIYNCPAKSHQQGTHESILCARPSLNAYQVSSWSEMEDYYNPEDVIKAAGILLSSADKFKGNNNFEYDIVDIVRQAVAEKGRLVYPIMISAYKAHEAKLFKDASERFLELIMLQDKLLATRSEFTVGHWLNEARSLGNNDKEKDLYEWNARKQITTWGDRENADKGGLRDYAHKEWSGLLRDFYYARWKKWTDVEYKKLTGEPTHDIDFYEMENRWAEMHNKYASKANGDPIETAKEVYENITSH